MNGLKKRKKNLFDMCVRFIDIDYNVNYHTHIPKPIYIYIYAIINYTCKKKVKKTTRPIMLSFKITEYRTIPLKL